MRGVCTIRADVVEADLLDKPTMYRRRLNRPPVVMTSDCGTGCCGRRRSPMTRKENSSRGCGHGAGCLGGRHGVARSVWLVGRLCAAMPVAEPDAEKHPAGFEKTGCIEIQSPCTRHALKQAQAIPSLVDGSGPTAATPLSRRTSAYKPEPRLSSRPACDKCPQRDEGSRGMALMLNKRFSVPTPAVSARKRIAWSFRFRANACDERRKSLKSRLFPPAWVVVSAARSIQ